MPYFSEISFVPSILVVMNLYICDLSLGSGLTDAFSSYDCTTFCYHGKHLVYVIVSFITLLVYFPVFFYLRPIWQNFQATLDIMTNPSSCMIKGCFQVLFVILSKSLGNSNMNYFGVFYSIALAVYCIVLFKIEFFNYKVANLWLAVSVALVAFGELIYSITALSLKNPNDCLIILMIGWALILISGYVLQRAKYKSYLYTEDPLEVREIFDRVFRNRYIVS